MPLVVFSAIQPTGEFRESSVGGLTLESCFTILDVLVCSGWQLLKAVLVEPGGNQTDLPVDAFTGYPMAAELNQLEQSWNCLLANHDYFRGVFAKKRMTEAAINASIQQHDQISRNRLATTRQIVALFEKMDRLQHQIQQAKDEWDVK